MSSFILDMLKGIWVTPADLVSLWCFDFEVKKETTILFQNKNSFSIVVRKLGQKQMT